MSQFSKTHRFLRSRISLFLAIGASVSLAACSDSDSTSVDHKTTIIQQDVVDQNTVDTSAKESATVILPSTRFDLSHWKLTLPTANNNEGKVDGVSVKELQSFSDENYFYIDELGHLVFTSPNNGGTTENSSNTRSELRYMSNVANSSVKSGDPSNNFALASHPDAGSFASVGGKMEVTMHVDHAPLNSNKPNGLSSYSAVIGQIHATKDKVSNPHGEGYGNEPLKIFYKKWPNHKTGSIYWNYERNLEKENPDRNDISYLVWGKSKTDATDPGEQGVALGEDFSYTVNVYKDTMYLTFESPRLGTVKHEINLADNTDANGKVDAKDNPSGYKNAANYFKAGVYNQCRGSLKKGETLAPCGGTGDWETDKANGDYAQVSFSRLVVTEADPQ